MLHLFFDGQNCLLEAASSSFSLSYIIIITMGRKNLPLAAANGKVGNKKQDTGLPSFFRHRKEQQAKQQAQQAQASPKGKGRLTSQRLQPTSITSSSAAEMAEHLRSANGGQAAVGIVDPSATAEGASSSSSFSPYEHLNQGSFHGGTKDSSVKAYGRHLRSLIEQSDVLIEVLDARDPMGSRSISSENLLLSHPGKKLLLVLTKIDLVPKATLQAWLVHLRQVHPTLAFKSTSTLSGSGRASRKLHTQTALTAGGRAVTSLEASSSATLLQLLKNYARSQPRGMSLTVGIFGPPNVGKSSLINSLVRSRACSVAPRPGETKTLQTVMLDRKVRLIDSPGVAMPSSNVSIDTQVQEVLRGTVKVELVEDPLPPIAEILRRADPVKVTKLYALPEIELEQGEAERLEDQQPGLAFDQTQSSTAEPPTRPSRVDFNTMRDEGGSDDEMNDGDADSDDDQDNNNFHRDDFVEQETQPADDDTVPASHPSKSRRGPIGYDASDPMDFLLRLALIKGKMLKGGRPDFEGAARGVINDWNSGKIAWFVKPPLSSTSVEARKQQREQDEDAQMVADVPPKAQDGTVANTQGRQEAAVTNEDPTVVTGFSQEFDLDALFAQADAQMFGGANGAASSAREAQEPTAAVAQTAASAVNLQAGDVSRSSLGKRGRGGADEDSADEADDGGSDSDGDSDDDDDEREPKRMSMPDEGDPQGQMEIVSDKSLRKPQATRPRGEDELSSFLSNASHKKGGNAQENLVNGKKPSSTSSTGPPKRGQRNKKKKNRNLEAHDDDGDVPTYVAKQQHKATLPLNMKKSNIHNDDAFDDVGIGRGTTAKKRGEERKKKRKLARREGREDGGVWRELEEVTLD